MSTCGFPDIQGFYDMLYGTAGIDCQGLTVWLFAGAAGIVFPGNPAFGVTDFLNMYSKFFGPPSSHTGLTSTLGSATVSGFTSTTIAGLAAGQLIVDPAFPTDTIIVSVDTVALTVTAGNPAIANGTTLTVYQTPFVPLVVISVYLNLAQASVMFSRYQEAWPLCMALFVAHYLTLFMRTESGPNLTAGEVAASGLTKGILISRHAGDVGAQSQLISSYEQWGAWTETQYGEQFITLARATNIGPIWVQ